MLQGWIRASTLRCVHAVAAECKTPSLPSPIDKKVEFLVTGVIESRADRKMQIGTALRFNTGPCNAIRKQVGDTLRVVGVFDNGNNQFLAHWFPPH